MDFVLLRKFIEPLAFIVGGFVLGFIFEKFVLRKLRKLTQKTPWEGGEIIVASLKGSVFASFILFGMYFAIKSFMGESVLAVKLDSWMTVAFIFIATLILSRIASGFVQIYNHRMTGAAISTSIFSNLTQIIIFIIGALTMLEHLKISITPILTALGVGGLAVALALQDTLSNMFAGINIIASKQIKPGDYIKLPSGDEGFVTDITLRYTTIRALSNTITIIPNSQLSKTIAVNFDLPEKEMSIPIEVGVSYGSDLNKVEGITIDVAKTIMQEVEGGIPDFLPYIRYHTFGNSSINFTVVMRGRRSTDQSIIKHEFIKMLHKRYQEEGIEIPFSDNNGTSGGIVSNP